MQISMPRSNVGQSNNNALKKSIPATIYMVIHNSQDTYLLYNLKND